MDDPEAVVPLAEVIERHVIEGQPVRVTLHLPSNHVCYIEDPVMSPLRATLDGAASRPDAWLDFDRKPNVPRQALMSRKDFDAYLEDLRRRYSRSEPLPIAARLDIRATRWGESGGGNQLYRVGCYLENATPSKGTSLDKYHILADARIEGVLLVGKLHPIEILPVPKDYQYDRRVWAVGHGTSVQRKGDNRFVTEALARYDQIRRATRELPAARFADLIDSPLQTLETIRLAMAQYAENWEQRVIRDNERGFSEPELTEVQNDLAAFRDEEERFTAGIAALNGDRRLLNAFVSMNKVFQRVARGNYDAWRLFQIVFIVTQLPALAVREGILRGEWPSGQQHDWAETLDWADVLWFPTGGGKTEAYLGLISCAMLYDRLRGKSFGVTAWLRFPLRMLSVQQLQRAMKVVWETEKEHKALLGEKASETDPIALGYFVGRSSTPNWLEEEDLKRFELLPLVPKCPECNGDVEVKKDFEKVRIVHTCNRCGELPVYVSDGEIYRYLPSLLVGTVDKIATLGFQTRFAQLWGGARWRCPVHGYGHGQNCLKSCRTRRRDWIKVEPYDGAPTFHVQDELHLLQEELGAFAGHYETLLRHCEAKLGGHGPKIIAATATIEGFQHQVQHIYATKGVRRFPERGYDRMETFYTRRDTDPETGEAKVARVYVGFRPTSRRAEDAAALCTEIFLREIRRLYENPYEAATFLRYARTQEEVQTLLRHYSTVLSYVNSLNSGTRVRDALDRTGKRINPDNRDINIELTSSRSSMADLADLVDRLENPPGFDDTSFLDAVVATSIISHGVDVERINLMVMDRVPDEVADYIQASSRSGRIHVGLVVGVLPSYSVRAGSIYHRFREFHEHLDRLVAPIPVNRFAKYAAERTASGLLIGLLFGRFNPQEAEADLYARHRAEAFLREHKAEVWDAYQEAYAIDEQIYAPDLVASLREKLTDRYERIFHSIRASDERHVTSAVRPKPMMSLRDVEEGVPFTPSREAAALADWVLRTRS